MNKQEREKAIEIRKMEALRRRTSKIHPKYPIIEETFKKKISGYNGEKSLDYYLKFFDKKYHIFNNLRLLDPLTMTHFEIDSLIFSPKYTLIIGAKNHKGSLHFDHQFNQMHQTSDDTKITYPCPTNQMFRHQIQLKRLLETYKIPVPPIEGLVVITNPSTSISATPNHPSAHKIIHSPSLISKIDLFEKRHKTEILPHRQIQKLPKLFRKLHTPYDKDILKRYGITKEELLKGVFCPECGALPLGRTQRMWYCTSCGHTSKTAHLDAIMDYALLIDTKITNKELRDFLLLSSRTAAKYILLGLKLEHSGNTKGRTYFLPLNGDPIG